MSRTRRIDPMIAQAEHVLRDVHLPRILACLHQLSVQQIWWRPNEASNSVGNLVLHLEGNVRQWIISGLGGAEDRRQRDVEFSERGSMSRRALAGGLQETVGEASQVLRKLAPEALDRVHTIQKFHVTGRQAAFHVAEHFSHHAGQIILLTKMLEGKDLKFTKLPGGPKNRKRSLPAW